MKLQVAAYTNKKVINNYTIKKKSLLRDEINSLIELLCSITIEDWIKSTVLNQRIKVVLTYNNWKAERNVCKGKGNSDKIDFYREVKLMGCEVEFANRATLAHDLFKLEKMYKEGSIKVGVIVVVCNSFIEFMKTKATDNNMPQTYWNRLNYEKCIEYLELYNYITVPLYILGLEPDNIDYENDII